MPPNFNDIPYDVWHEIATYLGPEDYINLSLVNRDMYDLLKDEYTARKSAQKFMFHAAECRLAETRQISYRQAIRRAFDVREAVATAQPYSVSIVGYADSFQFRQGVLCYVDGESVRVLNVREAEDTEQVIDMRSAFSEAVVPLGPRDHLQTTLLHYSDGILTCLCEMGSSWLMAFDIGSKSSARVAMARLLTSTRELFVRNNASYLYYGTHSGAVEDSESEHFEWLINGVCISKNQLLTKRPVQLENVVGSEIGSSVCFEIRDEFLYVVSNQTAHDEEEVDWTSFYVCVRIPLSNPTEPMWQRYWRRQHQEGPLNDSWTNLSLQTDEETGNLNIVECRREWRDGGSENYRTYYMQPIDRPSAGSEWEAGKLDPVTMNSPFPADDPPSPGFPRYRPVSRLPSNDPLTRTLSEFSKPNYVPPRKRVRRQYHDEYTSEERDSEIRKDFPLSKTKFCAYNHPASSFIDLVNDPVPSGSFSAPPEDRLRFRIGSRKRKCPMDEAGEEVGTGFLYPPKHHHEDGSPMEYSEERFESRGIKLWPPDDAPEELFRIICPRSASGDITAVADERMIIYSTRGPSKEDHRRMMVLVNFDPTIRFRGLKPLKSHTNVERSSGREIRGSLENEEAVSIPPSSLPSLSKAKSYSTTSRPYSDEQFQPFVHPEHNLNRKPAETMEWYTTQKAMHLEMTGYWLR